MNKLKLIGIWIMFLVVMSAVVYGACQLNTDLNKLICPKGDFKDTHLVLKGKDNQGRDTGQVTIGGELFSVRIEPDDTITVLRLTHHLAGRSFDATLTKDWTGFGGFLWIGSPQTTVTKDVFTDAGGIIGTVPTEAKWSAVVDEVIWYYKKDEEGTLVYWNPPTETWKPSAVSDPNNLPRVKEITGEEEEGYAALRPYGGYALTREQISRIPTEALTQPKYTIWHIQNKETHDEVYFRVNTEEKDESKRNVEMWDTEQNTWVDSDYTFGQLKTEIKEQGDTSAQITTYPASVINLPEENAQAPATATAPTAAPAMTTPAEEYKFLGFFEKNGVFYEHFSLDGKEQEKIAADGGTYARTIKDIKTTFIIGKDGKATSIKIGNFEVSTQEYHDIFNAVGKDSILTLSSDGQKVEVKDKDGGLVYSIKQIGNERIIETPGQTITREKTDGSTTTRTETFFMLYIDPNGKEISVAEFNDLTKKHEACLKAPGGGPTNCDGLKPQAIKSHSNDYTENRNTQGALESYSVIDYSYGREKGVEKYADEYRYDVTNCKDGWCSPVYVGYSYLILPEKKLEGAKQEPTKVVFDAKGNIDKSKTTETNEAELQKAKTARTQANTRRMFSRFDAIITEFAGLKGYSKLFFSKEMLDQWREKVDSVFSSMYLGTEYWESAICKHQFDKAGDGVAYIELPGGIIKAAAHVEGRISSKIEIPGKEEYVYQITGSVRAVGAEVKFRINAKGKGETYDAAKGTITVEKDKSWTAAGETSIVFSSDKKFTEVCINFIERGEFEEDICNSIEG